MTLAATMEALTASCDAEDEAHYNRLAAHLKKSKLAEHALKVGDIAPPIDLPAAGGGTFSLSEGLAARPQIVIFARGAWCAYCVAEIAALKAAKPALDAAGLGAIVVTPHLLGGVTRLSQQLDLPFPVICDVDMGCALAYGCLFAIPPQDREMLRYDMFDIATEYGLDGRFMPIPNCYGIDQDGRVVSSFANDDFRFFPEIDEIIEATVSGIAARS